MMWLCSLSFAAGAVAMCLLLLAVVWWNFPEIKQ